MKAQIMSFETFRDRITSKRTKIHDKYHQLARKTLFEKETRNNED